MSRKEVKLYEFRGELLTATQIRDKYNIPDRLVWKAFNDDSKPTLEQMIDWRESNGITDINDYRCGSMKMCRKKRGIEIYPYFTRQAQPEKTQTIKEGSRYGVYTVIGRSRKHKVNHINVFCTKCFKTHYDLPLSTFLNACDDKKCSCDKLGIYHIIDNYRFAALETLRKFALCFTANTLCNPVCCFGAFCSNRYHYVFCFIHRGNLHHILYLLPGIHPSDFFTYLGKKGP